jgi:DNA-binding MarR family transcriptional regulator
MSEKFNPDAFTTFLETVKPAAKQTGSDPSLPVVLKTLAGASGGQMEVSDLLRQTGIPIGLLASMLQQLESQKLVTRTLSSGKELVQLTDSGRELAGV